MISILKRGNVYQYQFDIAPVEGERKRVTKLLLKVHALLFFTEVIYNLLTN